MEPFFDITGIDEKNLTEEQIKEWLSKANLNKLNVFYDRNRIIVILCKALLKAWENIEKKT
jgi:hypothetical protein